MIRKVRKIENEILTENQTQNLFILSSPNRIELNRNCDRFVIWYMLYSMYTTHTYVYVCLEWFICVDIKCRFI